MSNPLEAWQKIIQGLVPDIPLSDGNLVIEAAALMLAYNLPVQDNILLTIALDERRQLMTRL